MQIFQVIISMKDIPDVRIEAGFESGVKAQAWGHALILKFKSISEIRIYQGRIDEDLPWEALIWAESRDDLPK